MNANIEKKIDHLIEEAIGPIGKGALMAGVGGMLGAGLDVYFNNGKNLDDFLKPLAAWGLGGAVGAALQDTAASKEEEEKIKKIAEKTIEEKLKNKGLPNVGN